MSGEDDSRRRRFEGLHRGRRGRFELHWFRADPGAPRASARWIRFTFQLLLATIAIAVGVLTLFPFVWERQSSPCAAVEALVWRRTFGAVQVQNGARPGFIPGIRMQVAPGGTLPEPIRCYIAYWRRI
ncbi:hypothetical protein GWK16_04455 [Roseomonas sp. JC162]|uniref:Uncharacterized protein n=1 Tax=Neoroseomonas marina TaxID=1232220 RepID=A0A848E7S9_9PROT|nr:hypothetical protein [Neoroseomonas marina]NMJ40481.1 hypothetical protein [Neoroseomonas marina]